jgi:ferredoxin
MKVRIDSDACQGHGQCVMLCPTIFTADEEGFGVVRHEEVPPDQEQDVRQAEASCPERAIHITR